MKTCCQYHKPATGCNQGRGCPERTRRVQEAELRRGAIGYESALPEAFTADPPKPPRAIDWQEVFIWGAVAFCFTAVIALSIYQP
jgi:hypothetical protein